LSRRKGHKQAIEAIASLPDDAMLVLAGGKHPDDSTTYASELEDMIVERGLQHKVRITGYLNPAEVASIMSATDVVLAPFESSSGSGSLAMAFACGKPIVASDIAPHQEILNESPGALAYYRAGDAIDLAAIIKEMRKNARLREEYVSAARRYAEAHSYLQAARQTVEVYESVLGGAA
jgi:glycosyltransferase involved in cell wall biosynthesis